LRAVILLLKGKKIREHRPDLRFSLLNTRATVIATAITKSGTATAIAMIVTLFLEVGDDEGDGMSPNLAANILKDYQVPSQLHGYHQDIQARFTHACFGHDRNYDESVLLKYIMFNN
jgi:hypothetical protein